MWGAQWLSPFSGHSSSLPSVSESSPTSKNASSTASTAPPHASPDREPHRPPPSSGNCGTFNVGSIVEYFSASKAVWIPARVLAVNANGTYNLDVKPNVTLDKVRAASTALAGAGTPATYAVGEIVQYFSASGGAWIQARVRAVNGDGTYDLDCKPQVPASKIRKPEAAAPAASSPVRAPPGSASTGYPEPPGAGEGRTVPPSSSSRAPAGSYAPGSVQRDTPSSHASAAPEPPHVTNIRRRLTEATMSGDITRLQAVLDEARQCGVVGPEVVQARETIQSMEAANMQHHALQVVEDAIESEDFWKLQAAMATAVGSGMHAEVGRIQDAMRTCKRRNGHVKELRRAAEARDAAALRRAIEVALQDHVQEKHVRPARDALRSMEARASAGQQLRQALTVRSVALLQSALEAAQSAGIDVSDAEFGESIRAVRTELHSKALEQLHGLLQTQDANGLRSALQEWRARGLDEATLAPFAKKVQALDLCGRLRQDVQSAMRSHDHAALQAALQAAEAAGLGDTDLRPAKDMLRAHQAREAQERQQQEREAQQKQQREREHKNAMEAQQRSAAARSAVTEDLRSALRGDNVDRLAAAIAAAERAGIGHGPEVVHAEERLRALRSQGSASRDLEEALQSGDVYRLRAAIATARGAGVGEAELRRAEGALRTFSAQAQARRALETAMASRNAEMLRAAVDDAKRAGLPQQEVSRAEIALSSMTHTSVTQELRSAMAAGNVEKLRVAAGAAMDAGHESGAVAAAWAQVRSLEWQQSARRELEKATHCGDGARLQAAIEHAQSAGLSEAELAPARAELHMRAGRQQAQHDLQLARASGDVWMLRDKLKAAMDAGLTGGLVDSAAAELKVAQGLSTPSPRFPGQHSPAYEATVGAYTVPDTNPHWHPGY